MIYGVLGLYYSENDVNKAMRYWDKNKDGLLDETEFLIFENIHHTELYSTLLPSSVIDSYLRVSLQYIIIIGLQITLGLCPVGPIYMYSIGSNEIDDYWNVVKTVKTVVSDRSVSKFP